MKDELNRAMAEIMGLCWHEFSEIERTRDYIMYQCSCGTKHRLNCGHGGRGYYETKMAHESKNPNYTSDLNLVRKVEMMLVEMGMGKDYLFALGMKHVDKFNLHGDDEVLLATVLADAKTRCLAIKKTWEEGG